MCNLERSMERHNERMCSMERSMERSCVLDTRMATIEKGYADILSVLRTLIQAIAQVPLLVHHQHTTLTVAFNAVDHTIENNKVCKSSTMHSALVNRGVSPLHH